MIGNINLSKVASLPHADVPAQPAGHAESRPQNRETPTSAPAPPASAAGRRMNRPPSITVGGNLKEMGDNSKVNMKKLLNFGAELYYHGSRSASLLAFTDYAGASKNRLLPMGVMLERGIFPFCGEAGGTYAISNSLHPESFNREHLSVVTANHFDSPHDYANDVNTATWDRDAEAQRDKKREWKKFVTMRRRKHGPPTAPHSLQES
jgi:hypothetical protein